MRSVRGGLPVPLHQGRQRAGPGFCVEACPVNALGMTKLYEYSTENKRDLYFDKKKLYEIGEKYFADAKAYLVAHRQEQADETAIQYRYKFPFPVLTEKKE
jgi:NADH-quinone oxidoreductase subunit I